MIDTPWQRARKSRSERQEEGLGRLAGASQVPHSGRIWPNKRDARIYDFLVEARDTESGSYRINLSEWEDITKQGHVRNAIPAMQINLGTERLFVMRFSDWQEFFNQMVELKERLDAQD